MKAYACGQCGGPLAVPKGDASVICNYCGYSNDITNIEADFEKFRAEVQSWLGDLGVTSHAGIDAGMRRLYFRDEIYPDLITELANIVGNTEDILDYPLLYLNVYRQLPDLAIRTDWSVDVGKPMKEFSRRLASPELANFAADPKSRKMLLDLKLQALMIPMLMDVVDLSSDPTKDNLQRCSNTLRALADEVQGTVDITSKSKDLESDTAFYQILRNRLAISSNAYSRLAGAIESREPLDKAWVNEQMKTLYELKGTLKGLAGVSVVDKVPLDYGLTNDGGSLATWHNILRAYFAITEKPFSEFVRIVERFAASTFFYHSTEKPGVDISWFSENIDSRKFTWFMDSLSSAISADSIRMAVPTASQSDGQFLYPFYLLYIETILRSGSLWWKKGEAEDYHALCDAAFNLHPGFYTGDYPSLMSPGGKKIIGKRLEGAMDNLAHIQERPALSGMTVLPPTVSPDDARRMYLQAHNFWEEAEYAKSRGIDLDVPRSYKDKGFDPGRVKAVAPKVVGLYYIPMKVSGNDSVIMGKGFELNERLPHRIILAREFTSFIRDVQ